MKTQKKCIKQIILAILIFTAINLVIVFTFSVYEPTIALAGDSDSKSDEIYYGAYNGGGSAIYTKESFDYATRSSESYFINPSFPKYFNATGDLKNACANVGGANIIGYYDRFFTNLIPDCEPGYFTTRYNYYPMGKNVTAIQALIRDLYTRMETNTSGEGSTQTQYKNGLASYIKSKGWNATFNSVMTEGKFDLDKAIEQFKKGNPITLFLSKFIFTSVADNGSNVVWDKLQYDDNHIAVAYGYNKVTYYDANGKVIKSVVYLYVASGLQGVDGHYILNMYGDLVDAEAVHIA